jgi:hypothetical protein
LLLAVRALSSAAQTTDENAVVEGIQQTASAVMRISGLVEEAAEEHPDNSAYQKLLLTTQETREHVVAYIRHTRKAFANPLDYMTRQELDATKKRVCTFCARSHRKVAEGVKAVIETAHECPDLTSSSNGANTPQPEDGLTLLVLTRKLVASLYQLGTDIEEMDVGNFKSNAKYDEIPSSYKQVLCGYFKTMANNVRGCGESVGR